MLWWLIGVAPAVCAIWLAATHARRATSITAACSHPAGDRTDETASRAQLRCARRGRLDVAPERGDSDRRRALQLMRGVQGRPLVRPELLSAVVLTTRAAVLAPTTHLYVVDDFPGGSGRVPTLLTSLRVNSRAHVKGSHDLPKVTSMILRSSARLLMLGSSARDMRST
jgi:hypothetical protein